MKNKKETFLFMKKILQNFLKNGGDFARAVRAANLASFLNIHGVFEAECWRKGELLWTTKGLNLWTDEGINRILDTMFHGTTQISTWYVAIFEDDHTVAAGDNYDVPGYTECTAYDESTRPEYEEAAASSKSMTNSANPADFTISDTKTIYGASLVSVNTKGDHTEGANNVLACASKFSAEKSVEDDDTLRVTYTVSGADS